jgi:hypothetical protein
MITQTFVVDTFKSTRVQVQHIGDIFVKKAKTNNERVAVLKYVFSLVSKVKSVCLSLSKRERNRV